MCAIILNLYVISYSDKISAVHIATRSYSLEAQIMLKTNVVGSLIVCLVLFAILAYLFAIGLSLDWKFYFKVAGIVAVIAAIVGLAASCGDKA